MTGKNNSPLVITMGEPAGISWEITAKVWENHLTKIPGFYLLDDFERLQSLNNTIPIKRIDHPSQAKIIFPDALPILHSPLSVPATFGQPSKKNAKDVIASIKLAVDHVTSGLARGMITNPIQKNTLYSVGFNHPGHTEYLGELNHSVTEPLMMLTSQELRVVPVSTHINLSDAIKLLNEEQIIRKAVKTAEALCQDFNIKNPHIAVAGLNPHAGEGGALGSEEIEIISPAIQKLKNKGLRISGPYPPDVMFSGIIRQTYDAALCMYHDQALIPIKTLDFEGTVNVTLGLDFVRTSPDHGTALDIAGKGMASEKSLLAAINMAHQIANNRSLKHEM